MTHQIYKFHCSGVEPKLDIIFFIFLTNYYLWFQTTWIQITLNYPFHHNIDTNRAYFHLGLCFKRFIYRSNHCFYVSTNITRFAHISVTYKTMDFLNGMHSFRLQFKATPLHSDGDYWTYLWRCECCDDYIWEISRILRLNFNVEVRFWIDAYLWYKFERRCFLLFLKKPAKHAH